jgi:hypothetical protein
VLQNGRKPPKTASYAKDKDRDLASLKSERESTPQTARRRAQNPASIGDTQYLPLHSSPRPPERHLFTKKESAPARPGVVWRGAGRSK